MMVYEWMDRIVHHCVGFNDLHTCLKYALGMDIIRLI